MLLTTPGEREGGGRKPGPAGTMAGAGTRNDRQSQRAQEVACVRAARGSLTDPHQINDRE